MLTQPTPAHKQPYGAIRMMCLDCGNRFSYTIKEKDGLFVGDVKCPKCGELDTDIDY